MGGRAADIDQDTLALTTHRRKHGAIYAQPGDRIRIEDLGELFGCERLGHAEHQHTRIVNDHIDPTLFQDDLIHGRPATDL